MLLGHEVVRFGAIATGEEVPWVLVAEQVARAVAQGSCDEAVLLCYTGTGVSMAANKIPGVRAALCTDPATTSGARLWNHANVLCLSNRLLSEDLCKEILAAWFSPYDPSLGAAGVAMLADLERSRG